MTTPAPVGASGDGSVPDPPAAQDFYRLRREGIGHLERTGSAAWTDYNTHDPGITLLEGLIYAITDLAYRTDFPIEDLLASAVPSSPPPAPVPGDPYPDQAFFSARTILTINPTTPEDVRRLLLDIETVRNAWVDCDGSADGCGAGYVAWCEDGELVLSYDPAERRDPATAAVRVVPRGLYRVQLELEADPDLGDLNDRKIVRRRTIVAPDGRRHIATVEVRFPPWSAARRAERRHLVDAAANTTDPAGTFGVSVTEPTRTPTGTTPVDDAELRRRWSDVFFIDYAITLDGLDPIVLENASVRLFGDDTVRGQAGVDLLHAWLGDTTADGFVPSYGRKLAATKAAVAATRAVLAAHRNLDEDVGRIDLVTIDDIAVCADVQVEATADIELVQARIWFEIERYLDPAVAFASLDELRAAGMPTDTLFNGPELASGFLADPLPTAPRTELRVSDLLNLLIDIDGVISVDNLLLTGYDAMGVAIRGAADPDWADGTLRRDPNRISASWLLLLPADHRPRLHHGLSRFLFTAGGLPFLPRLDEAEDTLVQLHGQAARPALPATALDLTAPAGRRRKLSSYQPVQHSLPLTYGTGPAGLPSTASTRRRAQARQLKAYLMVYEQLLRNAYAQLAHTGDLFSLDSEVAHTYFGGMFDKDDIAGVFVADPADGFPALVDPALTAPVLAGLLETPTEFLERRNRFLDHLLARFGESFGEYALLLTDLDGQTRARSALIADKLAFLRDLPRLGHDRGRAFDRTQAPTGPGHGHGIPAGPGDVCGLLDRVRLLLGQADLTRAIVVEHLLLRPKFPGDALYPACSDGGCGLCGDEDPYSFRLTFVLPGATKPFDTNLAMRGFADRTIREQTPAHLLVKICWAGADSDASPFTRFEAAWYAWRTADARIDWDDEHLHDAVLDLLSGGAAPPGSHDERCACATALLTEFGTQFRTWLNTGLAAGRGPDQLIGADGLIGFAPPALTCTGLELDQTVLTSIREWLLQRYTGYAEVSYRLAVLVRALADLRNTYPRATLHDCDEGSDLNPVRLGQTVLGSD